MKIIIEVADEKADYALEFFKNISFVKKASLLDNPVITNEDLLARIEAYETGNSSPTKLNMDDLKAIVQKTHS